MLRLLDEAKKLKKEAWLHHKATMYLRQLQLTDVRQCPICARNFTPEGELRPVIMTCCSYTTCLSCAGKIEGGKLKETFYERLPAEILQEGDPTYFPHTVTKTHANCSNCKAELRKPWKDLAYNVANPIANIVTAFY